jgi:hypothetical protein
MTDILPNSDTSYRKFLQDFKAHIVQSRITAAKAVNRAHVGLYWNLGKLIVDRQKGAWLGAGGGRAPGARLEA